MNPNMKKLILICLALNLAILTHAAAIDFKLSPAGKDAAIGLSPMNEVPPVTNSVGSGNTISGGISFDTNSSILTVMFGFGSAAGFSNLTAAATAVSVQGPAGPGTNSTTVVADLTPHLFTQTNPAAGGIVYGQITVSSNGVANLLGGLYYINVHTTNNPNGEIRGQLIPQMNLPPVIVCPEASKVECGGSTTLASKVSDPEGDAIVVVWSVNGVAIQTNMLASGSTMTPTTTQFTAEFPLGTNSVSLSATDSAGNEETCSTTVTVVDTIPPVITQAAVSPSLLWPPFHQMVPVQVSATATDLCGPATWKITSISSSEAVNAPGSGNTSPDWQITGPHTASLRAERSGITGPRIYTITIVAVDGSGNLSQPKTVTVTVPHNR
jgi:hypothetical protein